MPSQAELEKLRKLYPDIFGKGTFTLTEPTGPRKLADTERKTLSDLYPDLFSPYPPKSELRIAGFETMDEVLLTLKNLQNTDAQLREASKMIIKSREGYEYPKGEYPALRPARPKRVELNENIEPYLKYIAKLTGTESKLPKKKPIAVGKGKAGYVGFDPMEVNDFIDARLGDIKQAIDIVEQSKQIKTLRQRTEFAQGIKQGGFNHLNMTIDGLYPSTNYETIRIIPFLKSLAEEQEQGMLRAIDEKFKRAERERLPIDTYLNPSEIAFIKANQTIDKDKSHLPISYRIGESMAMMIPWGAEIGFEIAVTKALGFPAAPFMRGVRPMLKAIAHRGLRTIPMVLMNMPSVRANLHQYSRDDAQYFQTPEGRIVNRELIKEGDAPLKAIAKAVGSDVISTFSEQLGEILGVAGRYAFIKFAKKTGAWRPLGMRWLRPVADVLTDYRKFVQFSSLPGEIFEEKIEALMRPILGEKYSPPWTKQFWEETLTEIASLGAFGAITGIPGRVVNYSDWKEFNALPPTEQKELKLLTIEGNVGHPVEVRTSQGKLAGTLSGLDEEGLYLDVNGKEHYLPVEMMESILLKDRNEIIPITEKARLEKFIADVKKIKKAIEEPEEPGEVQPQTPSAVKDKQDNLFKKYAPHLLEEQWAKSKNLVLNRAGQIIRENNLSWESPFERIDNLVKGVFNNYGITYKVNSHSPNATWNVDTDSPEGENGLIRDVKVELVKDGVQLTDTEGRKLKFLWEEINSFDLVHDIRSQEEWEKEYREVATAVARAEKPEEAPEATRKAELLEEAKEIGIDESEIEDIDTEITGEVELEKSDEKKIEKAEEMGRIGAERTGDKKIESATADDEFQGFLKKFGLPELPSTFRGTDISEIPNVPEDKKKLLTDLLMAYDKGFSERRIELEKEKRAEDIEDLTYSETLNTWVGEEVDRLDKEQLGAEKKKSYEELKEQAIFNILDDIFTDKTITLAEHKENLEGLEDKDSDEIVYYTPRGFEITKDIYEEAISLAEDVEFFEKRTEVKEEKPTEPESKYPILNWKLEEYGNFPGGTIKVEVIDYDEPSATYTVRSLTALKGREQFLGKEFKVTKSQLQENNPDITLPTAEDLRKIKEVETGKKVRIKHFTKKENIPLILEKGFDANLPPVFGVGTRYGKREEYKPEDKIGGKDVLYFTSDTERWNKANVYVGEGKGEKDYTYYDYDKQDWVTEKNALTTINLEPIEAEIKEGAKILVLDTLDKYLTFQKENLPDKVAFVKERLSDVVKKAKELGYDIVNVKYTEGKWNFRGQEMYAEATGFGGKNDYFILNREAIDILKPEEPADMGEFGFGVKKFGDLKLDEDRFQIRFGLNEQKVQGIVGSIKEKGVKGIGKPILIWKDPTDQQYYVLAGHHRMEALKRWGATATTEVPIQYFEGTEEEAIIKSQTENIESTAYGIKEAVNLVRKWIEQGRTEEQIKNDLGGTEPGQLGREFNKFIDLTHLDPNGKFMDLYAQGSEKYKEIPLFERWARFVGEIRGMYPDKLTNQHESQIFDWLWMVKTDKNYRMPKEKFFDLINKQVLSLIFDPKRALILKKEGMEERPEKKVIPEAWAIYEKLQEELTDLQKKYSDAETPEERKVKMQRIIEKKKEIDDVLQQMGERIKRQGELEFEPKGEAEKPETPEGEKPKLPEGYRIQEIAGKFDIYNPKDELVGTRNTEEDAIKYAQVHAEKPEAPKGEPKKGLMKTEKYGIIDIGIADQVSDAYLNARQEGKESKEAFEIAENKAKDLLGEVEGSWNYASYSQDKVEDYLKKPGEKGISEKAKEARKEAEDDWDDLGGYLGDKEFANPLADPVLWEKTFKLTKSLIKAGALTFADYVNKFVEKIGRLKTIRLAPVLEKAWREAKASFPFIDDVGRVEDVIVEKPEEKPTEEKAEAEGEKVIEHKLDREVIAEQQMQTPWVFVSQGTDDFQVLVPVHLYNPMQNALNEVVKEVGNIDDYVAKELDVDRQTLYSQLSRKQIETTGSVIYRLKKGEGYIVAWQTGLGKGRVGWGALLKWGRLQGLKPILFTSKTDLYTASLRDMKALGLYDNKETSKENFNPLIIHADKKVIDNETKEVVWTADGSKDLYEEIIKATPEQLRKIMEPYDCVFCTYPQIQRPGALQAEALKKLAINNLVILDESQNAAGTSTRNEVMVGNPDMNEPGLLENAKYVVYMSATPLKNPTNMPLYFRTALGTSDLPIDILIRACEIGGRPLQEWLTEMIARKGGFDRSEQAMYKVEINYADSWNNLAPAIKLALRASVKPDYAEVAEKIPERWEDMDEETQNRLKPVLLETLPVEARKGKKIPIEFRYRITEDTKEFDHKTMDEGTRALRDIIQMQNAVRRELADESSELVQELARESGKRPSEVVKSISIYSFTALQRFYIDELQLAIKAPHLVKLATESFKKGRKPVISLIFTMESFLTDFAEEKKIKIGDMFNFRFNDILQSGAKKVLKYKFNDAPRNSPPNWVDRVVDLELSPALKEQFETLVNMIDELPLEIPVSPIDYILKGLADAGVRMDEMTGRTVRVDYTGDVPVFSARPRKNNAEVEIDFQNGEIDGLIINQSASEGASLHSLPADPRPREHFIGQPDYNVAGFVQVEGRFHRVGEVNLPFYTYVSNPIPGEKRVVANMINKLAVLSAHITGSQKDYNALDNAQDMINEVGDSVAVQWLLNQSSDVWDKVGIRPDKKGNYFRRILKMNFSEVAGRINLLSVAEQEQAWEEIEEMYKAEIEHLNMINENPLAKDNMDLQFNPLESMILYEGTNQDDPFASKAIAYYGEANILRHPYNKAKIEEIVGKTLGIPVESVREFLARNKASKQFNETMELEAQLAVDNYLLRKRKELEPKIIADYIKRWKREFAVRDKEFLKETWGIESAEEVTEEFVRKTPEMMKGVNSDLDHRIDLLRKMTDRQMNELRNVLNKYKVGNTFTLHIKGFDTYDSQSGRIVPQYIDFRGVLFNVKFQPSKTGSPIASHRIQLQFAVNDQIQVVNVPLSKKDMMNGIKYQTAGIPADWDEGSIHKRKTEGKYVIVGNMLGANAIFTTVPFFKAPIRTFSMANGEWVRGIVIPKNREAQFKELIEKNRMVDFAEAYEWLKTNKGTIKTSDATKRGEGVQIRLFEAGDGIVTMPTAKGRKYHTTLALRDLMVNGFSSYGNEMRGAYRLENLREILRLIQNIGRVKFIIPSQGWAKTGNTPLESQIQEDISQVESEGKELNKLSFYNPQEVIYDPKYNELQYREIDPSVSVPTKLSQAVGENMWDLIKEFQTKGALGYGAKGFPVKGQYIAGVFMGKTQDIYSKSVSMYILSHEMVHWLDNHFNLRNNIMTPIDPQKRGLGRYSRESHWIHQLLTDLYVKYYPSGSRNHPLEKRIAEGLAVFFSRYIGFPEATKKEAKFLVNKFLNPGGSYYIKDIDVFVRKASNIIAVFQKKDALSQIGESVTNKTLERKIIEDEIEKSRLTKVARFFGMPESWLIPFLPQVVPLHHRIIGAFIDDKHNTEWMESQLPDVEVEIEGRKVKIPFKWSKESPTLTMRAYKDVNYIFQQNVFNKNGYYTLSDEGFTYKYDFNFRTIAEKVNALGDEDAMNKFDWWLVARQMTGLWKEIDAYRDELAEVEDRLAQVIEDLEADPEDRDLQREAKKLRERRRLLDKLIKKKEKVVNKYLFTREKYEEAYEEHKDKYAEVARMYDMLTRDMLDMAHHPAVQYLNDESYNNILTREFLVGFKNYSPLQQDLFDEIIGIKTEDYWKKQPVITSRGIHIKSLFRREGASFDIISPFYATVHNHNEMLHKCTKQMIWNKLLKLVEYYPEALSEVPLTRIPITDPKTGDVVIDFPQERDRDYIVARRNYKRVAIKINSWLRTIIDDCLTVRNMRLLEKLAVGATRIFVKGTTATYPPFALVNYLFLDAPSSAAQSMTKMKPVITGLSTMYKRLHQHDSPEAFYAREFLANGGAKLTFARMLDMPPKDFQEAILAEKKGLEKMMHWLDQGLNVLTFPVQQSEIFTRMTEYIRARMGKGTDGIKYSVFAAKEMAGRVTAPFHHIGRYGGALNLFPFSRASLNVLAQMIRTANNPKTRKQLIFVVSAITAAMIGAIANLLIRGSDDQKELFRNLSPEEYGRYVFLPAPDKKSLIKIRLPEQMAVFGSLVHIATSDILLKQKYDMNDYLDATTTWLPEQLNFTEPVRMLWSWFPQIIRPLAHTLAEKKTYPRVRPIESAKLKQLPVEQREYEYTQSYAKLLGKTGLAKKMKMSPVKIEYLVEGYFGRATRIYLGWSILQPFRNAFMRDLYFTSTRAISRYYELKEENQLRHRDMLKNPEKYSDEERAKVFELNAKLSMVENLLKTYRKIEFIDKNADELRNLRTQILDIIDTF